MFRSLIPTILVAILYCCVSTAGDLKFERLEKPGARTIVLIHGADSNRRTFDGIKGALAQNFDVIVVDLPGHGESAFLTETRLEPMAEALRDLLLTLKVKAAYFLGHSFGGRLVMTYAGLYPDHVQGVVIEDMDLLARTPAPAMVDDNPQIAFRCWAAAADYTNTLQRLWTPILVLKAAHESGISEAGEKHLIANANWCVVETIDGSTHNVHKSAPTLFLKSVTSFVSSVAKDELFSARLPIAIWRMVLSRLSIVEAFKVFRAISKAMKFAFDSGAIFKLITHNYSLPDYLVMLKEVANSDLSPDVKAKVISFLEDRREEIIRNIYARDYFAHIHNELEVGRREITQFEWALVTGFNPSRLAAFARTGTLVLNGVTILPARAQDNISPDDIRHFFIPALAALGVTIRLITEAEWKLYAEPSLDQQDIFETLAWYDQNANNEIHDVGELAPNRFGLFDVFGNVAEVVEAGANQFVARGGHYASTLLACLVARVLLATSAGKSSVAGFRVARGSSNL